MVARARWLPASRALNSSLISPVVSFSLSVYCILSLNVCLQALAGQIVVISVLFLRIYSGLIFQYSYSVYSADNHSHFIPVIA